MPFEFIQSALQQRRSQGLFRQEQIVQDYQQQFVVVDGKRYLNFSSNDYLGLGQEPASKQNDDLPLGSGGSSLVTGYSKQHQYLCEFLAERLDREAVLIFSSGFAANSSICQALGNQGKTHIVTDKLAHASMIEGAMSSRCQFNRFRHNDLTHLDSQLNRTSGDVLVMTEGVFSMDGDVAPVKPLVDLCTEHQSWLCIDDAHGFGVLGEQGFGTLELHGLNQQEVPVLMGTFGKAIGTSGAFIAGSHGLIEYLTNYARHYIYSTALSPFHIERTLHNLKLCQKQHWRREKLQANIAYFKTEMSDRSDRLLPSDTAIQPVAIGDPTKAIHVANTLKEKGLWVTAIRHPTVPKNTDRIRITLTALHEFDDISLLTKSLKEFV